MRSVIRGLWTVGLVALAAPVWAAPKFLDCARAADPAACRMAQSQLRDEAAAAGRDYGAMRNVALCLWDGCDGSVERDRKQSCQVRRKIMDVHKRKVDRSDEGHFATCVQAGY